MPQELFRTTKEEYDSIRETGFSEDQFASLITAFPSVIIAAADGDFQTEEKMLLIHIAKKLANVYEEDGLSDEEIELLGYRFYAEFDYLYWNRERWYKPFTKIMSEYLRHFPSDKKEITNMIFETAKASKKITFEELEKLDELKSLFGLK